MLLEEEKKSAPCQDGIKRRRPRGNSSLLIRPCRLLTVFFRSQNNHRGPGQLILYIPQSNHFFSSCQSKKKKEKTKKFVFGLRAENTQSAQRPMDMEEHQLLHAAYPLWPCWWYFPHHTHTWELLVLVSGTRSSHALVRGCRDPA